MPPLQKAMPAGSQDQCGLAIRTAIAAAPYHFADLLARPDGDSMSGCCLKAWGSQSVYEFSEPRESQAVRAVDAHCCENDAA